MGDPAHEISQQYDDFVNLRTGGRATLASPRAAATATTTGASRGGSSRTGRCRARAGNYDWLYFLRRRTNEDIRQPHSLPLQALGELGIVGGSPWRCSWARCSPASWRQSRRGVQSVRRRTLAVAGGGRSSPRATRASTGCTTSGRHGVACAPPRWWRPGRREFNSRARLGVWSPPGGCGGDRRRRPRRSACVRRPRPHPGAGQPALRSLEALRLANESLALNADWRPRSRSRARRTPASATTARRAASAEPFASSPTITFPGARRPSPSAAAG